MGLHFGTSLRPFFLALARRHLPFSRIHHPVQRFFILTKLGKNFIHYETSIERNSLFEPAHPRVTGRRGMVGVQGEEGSLSFSLG